jgi:hypothetical protein
MRQLEEDLGTFKEKNRELQDELQKKAGAVQLRCSETLKHISVLEFGLF